MVAVSKPVGQAVIPGRGIPEEPLSAQVSRHLGSKAFVVHRLDREASGLVLFAKDAETHRLLCGKFESREVHKTYLALVLGPIPEQGVIDQPIRAFGSGRMGIGPGGKASLTRYRVRERLKGAAWLEVEPVTGRRHQIRVHLYSAGHPIIGDPLYGAQRPVGGASRLMLHAYELSFSAGRDLELRAEPPEDFIEILSLFR